ncbi:polycomb group protein Psc-like [Neodiprion fabricii]|uniref:polycomb group protein Psc-like n=1 Tax=Neodiprion fabricii TaxID=2872261 RepID=UPI001ED93CF0|nr:polycomb group protein Psc-like [Neodiprion fabricii]XP_046421666.1 polycomb group protein Psc-like [Neodiprion fabricii]
MAVADGTRKPLVKDLHDHIVCPLCRGYLIDATTLVECLHSFCRGCIVRRLGSGARACPVCGALTLPPLLPDLALQHLVYLAVPGLYRSELERRRHFRLVNPQCPPPAPPLGGLTLTLDDAVSLSLCEIVNTDDVVAAAEEPRRRRRRPRPTTENGNDVSELVHEYADEENSNGRGQIRYLKCPAGVTVRHLVRLLALKRGWGDAEAKLPLKRIEMLYEYPKVQPSLPDKNYTGKPDMRPLELSWTLLDLACIFKWDKEIPMKLYYRVVQRSEETILQQQSGVPISLSSYNNTANNNNSTIGNNSNVMENVQRPPTPPPSPKQSSNPEMRTSVQPQPAQLSNTSKPRCKPTIKSLEILKPVSGVVRKVSEERTESEILVENTEETAPAVVAKSLNPISVELPAPPQQQEQQQQLIGSCGVQETVAQSVDANGSPVPSGETNGVKIKKPRCKVTPVMRAPGLQGSCSAAGTVNSGGTESNKSGRKLPRLEHHKRRKRRNKRLIAEITTTPREDLLKLKVRLTPCPPRITSSSGSAKEKLLQMRAVRREKIKTGTERPQTPPPSLPLTPPPSASIDGSPILLGTATTNNEETVVAEQPRIAKDSVANAASSGDPLPAQLQEETIEEIIDGIPDEVVRVAQIMNKSSGVKPIAAASPIEDQKKCSGVQVITVEDEVQEVQESKQHKKKDVQETAKKKSIFKVEDRDQREGVESATSVVGVCEKPEEKPKDEEVLRRLGLVAISEASKTLQDKIRNSQSSGGGGGAGGGIDYHRESLERQLRESKANRVRSLLAEKQMRDALKSIMSKSKPGGLQAGSSNGPKKGPPPLAPLTLKQGFSVPPKSAHPVQTKVNPHHVGLISSSARSRGAGSKIEKPLDLSSGANNALDLSPTPSCSNPVITSTTYSTSPAAPPTASKPTPTTTARGVVGADKSPERDVKKNQDLNLRTLSDAAVSLLRTSPTQASAAPCNPTLDHQVQRVTAANNSTNVQSSGNKVALRIPQPHQRISGFGNGMKIKPNLAVRHIPNPQAFVASQYNRNQRTSTGFFTAQQQPP